MTDTINENQKGIWQAVDLICDTPVLLILQSLWLGINRFDALHEATGLTKTVMSDRLKKLSNAEIISRRAYNTRPLRYEYIFQERGFKLFETALMMYRWENTWNPDGVSESFKLQHHTCGEYIMPLCACISCKDEVNPQDIDVTLNIDIANYPETYVKRRRQSGSAALKKEKPIIFQEIAEIFGDRWSTLIVRAAFFGVKRYDGFLKATNASTNILADRLSWLSEKGILKKQEYQVNPPRFEYVLRRKGLEILPILLFMLDWVDTVFAPNDPKTVTLRHTKCGSPLKVAPKCSHCGEILSFDELRLKTS
ncbi:helix-turn-helix domain-containing protein [Kordiimonas sp. SCSIO 12610]|uniref:winged helix-turn-helix transcriptional regulator n=1 Tax=Kordiimonas sp. SCSIO 12610 TaxID=2829597 RepID=UPI00210ACE88|nr:helix-turn-helix domain-containing protein [Kordiimonas sp. SCSIO 12610]UTW53985.1 helix-turn-helix transcriptional regulator [Kordiimonas sp. SCSIO 12610]